MSMLPLSRLPGSPLNAGSPPLRLARSIGKPRGAGDAHFELGHGRSDGSRLPFGRDRAVVGKRRPRNLQRFRDDAAPEGAEATAGADGAGSAAVDDVDRETPLHL